MRALALAGPRASRKRLSLFTDPRANLSVLESPSPEDVLRALSPERPDVVVIFGGDGTINRHLGQLAGAGIPMLAVPAGSGNDLARVAGTQTIGRALLAWQQVIDGSAQTQTTDLGLISSTTLAEPRHFSCCANVGLDADAARRTDSMPDWLKSHGGYFFGGLLALAGYQPANMKIATDERGFDEDAWFVSISNTPTFGGGLKIAPQASVIDGTLDITLVVRKNFSRAALARHFPKILSGKHVDIQGLHIFPAKHMTISTPTPQPVYADGEAITQTPCEITVAAGALQLVTLNVL